MRRFRMDGRKVICPKASLLGYSSNVARPGSWIVYLDHDANRRVARVLGRIAEVEDNPECRGWLAVVSPSTCMTAAYVRWIDPADVRECYAQPPQQLLSWLMGDWPTSKAGRERVVAMGEHGTLSEAFIATRDDPAKPYNCRPVYVAQWVLE